MQYEYAFGCYWLECVRCLACFVLLDGKYLSFMVSICPSRSSGGGCMLWWVPCYGVVGEYGYNAM